MFTFFVEEKRTSNLRRIFYIVFFTLNIFLLESDANKDRLISYDEFLTETKKDEFDEDPGWETMDMQVNMVFFIVQCFAF